MMNRNLVGNYSSAKA